MAGETRAGEPGGGSQFWARQARLSGTRSPYRERGPRPCRCVSRLQNGVPARGL